MSDPLKKLVELDERDAVFNTLSAAIIEALPDGLIAVDLEGRIVLVNQKAVLLFGYSRGELIGRRVEDLLPASLRDIHVQHRMDYNAFDLNPHARTMGLGVQLMGVRKDGRQLPLNIQIARAVTSEGIYNIAIVHYEPRMPERRAFLLSPPEEPRNAGSE